MENIIGRVSECFETGGRHFKHLTHNIMDKRGKLFFGLLGFCQGEGENERPLGMVYKFSKLTLQSRCVTQISGEKTNIYLPWVF